MAGKPSPWVSFPLLQLPPGVITEYIIPKLKSTHKAALALSCQALRQWVQLSYSQLHLPGGRCCLVTGHHLHQRVPNISEVKFTPVNLHEAMYVIPMFLMQVNKVSYCSMFVPGRWQ